ncbi:hypothetical protein GJU40_15980 [Bacillus lacus]|uniref:Restriction endonuclease type IV Mrr domain-containing protein n=1 Tax=Metabacillus lacus TaxID=1983721 RepID=A0A7X2M0U1_9BACI|nr:restriction endonuclease [Metabacillus lacus]MRX73642.1 hypothetical protein [Metabacillus lacus]
MKWLWQWSKRNFSNIFSVIGILITIYLGVYYVPGYLQDMRDERVNTINESLIENIQELLYYGQNVSIEEIDSLIKAKEIEYNISYPFTKDQLLIQVSGRFMDNKFIPLKQRTELVGKVQVLRKNIKEPPVKPKEKSVKNFIISLFTAIASIGFALVGGYSTIQKAKREREVQVNEDIEKREKEIQNNIMSSFSYEMIVKEALEGKNYVHHSLASDNGYDFKVQENNKEYALVCKYYYRPITVAEIRDLVNLSNNNKIDLIVVTNTKLTQSAKHFIEEYNNKNSNSIFVVQGDTKETIKSKLNEFFRDNI